MFVKVFRRKWFNARREGPFEVVRCTGTAVQVKGPPDRGIISTIV